MSSRINAYTIAGMRVEIISSVGDPAAYLPPGMPGFATAGPGEADLTITLRGRKEARAGTPRLPFPSHFRMESCGEGLSFDGMDDGKSRLGTIRAGCAEAEMELPTLAAARRADIDESAVREGAQTFVRACLQCRLMEAGGTFMHAAGVVWEGDGFVFTGHTRAGKTTLTRAFPAEAVLGDDLVAVRETQGDFVLYGTPWPGREGGTVAYGGVPLRAVFNLHPERESGLHRQSVAAALAELASNAPRMGYAGEESKLLAVFSSLAGAVPIYRLDMRLGDDVVSYLRQVSAQESGSGNTDSA